jgi:hypothetical protein
MNRNLLMLTFIFVLMYFFPAIGHEVKLPDGRTIDYSKLKQSGGGSCCGDEVHKDCQPVPSEWKNGGLEVDLGKPWGRIVIPESQVREPLPEAPEMTHACWNHQSDSVILYCVFGKATGV